MLREEIGQMKRERYRGVLGKQPQKRFFFIGNSGRGPVTPVIY